MAYEKSIDICTVLGRLDLGMASRAGLAQVMLERGDLAQAHLLAEQVLAALNQQPRTGWDEPFQAYLVCVRVFRANRDPRAEVALQNAQALLHEYASHIPDGGLRRSFLENVPVHWALQNGFSDDMAGQ